MSTPTSNGKIGRDTWIKLGEALLVAGSFATGAVFINNSLSDMKSEIKVQNLEAKLELQKSQASQAAVQAEIVYQLEKLNIRMTTVESKTDDRWGRSDMRAFAEALEQLNPSTTNFPGIRAPRIQ